MHALMKCLPLLSVALFPALLVAPVAAEQTASASSTVQSFNQAELDAMLAPVALYPDTVLSHLLIASTYPLEIIKAHRWVEEHPNYSAEQALDAVEAMDWDPSVKALVPFPQLLERMSDDIDWTQRLGDAFLGQEAQVLTSIQTLRNKAYAAGNLDKQQHIQVVKEEKTIIIEPASPQMVYLPYYDPLIVYGPWWWQSYPPVYWHVPVGYTVHRGFSWSIGIQISPGFYFSSFHWPRRQIVVIDHHHHWRDPYYYRSHQIVHHKKSHHWRHDPHHRRGVSYQAGYQPTREFSGQRSYLNKEQQRQWAAQTREHKGYGADRHQEQDKAQRFAEKDRQFERNNKGDELMRRAKEQGPRAQVEPTESRNIKDRQQVLRQELKNSSREYKAGEPQQQAIERVRPERTYQTIRSDRAEQAKFDRPVQQVRVEQPKVERSYQQARLEQPRIEQPRAERSYQQPGIAKPRMEQPRAAQSREIRSPDARRHVE
jgi:hypothetical protein